jgi:hypothetical protein
MRTIKSSFLLAGLLATMSYGSPAGAGQRGGEPVSFGNNSAQGSLGNVRNTSDRTQLIGCTLLGFPSGVRAVCVATNSAGTTRMCSSTEPGIIQAVQSINSDSFVFFEFNGSGDCTSVQVEAFSHYAPKQH